MTEYIIQRKQPINVTNLNDDFYLPNKTFDQQYSELYISRLNILKSILYKNAKNKWINNNNNLIIHKHILQMDINNKQQRCILVGCLYKEMIKRPNIFKEISKNIEDIIQYNQDGQEPINDENKTNIIQQSSESSSEQQQQQLSSYTSNDDYLILEDETARINLILDNSCMCKYNINMLVTGLIIGVLGTQTEKGQFLVEDIVFAGDELSFPPPSPHIKSLQENNTSSPYICLISGLKIGDIDYNPLATQFFVEYVQGMLSEEEKNHEICSRIIRIIVAGQSIEPIDELEKADRRTIQQNEIASHISDSLGMLDHFFTSLSSSVEIDVMPGESDPANFQLPQQPMASCLFPNASKWESFHCVTNPYHMNINGRDILGTSGQNIDNISQFSKYKNRIDLLENLLIWGHLFPTGPDTFSCYPFKENEPFVLNHLPSIFFVGNQPKFETKLYYPQNNNENLNSITPVRLICLPSFVTTHTAVLVNLDNLECETLSFSIDA